MNWLKTLFPRKRRSERIEVRRIPRAEHPISRSQFTQATLRTLYGLKDAGYQAYVVGGGVRDLLAGETPKDFDIATDAHPEDVKRIFRSCRLIGRRFVICHVRWGGEVVEVTTFRGVITDEHERDETGRILADNEYGTLETDAFRRDFTVNALYYDIRDYAIVDFAGGLHDMQARLIRLIGDPELRYREDPVRMLRAVRIANKLSFEIEKDTAAPIPKLAGLLREIPPARLFDEVIKLLQSREAVANLEGLHRYGLLKQILPVTDSAMGDARYGEFLRQALVNTAERLANDQTVSPAFLYAALLWPGVVREYQRLLQAEGQHPNDAISQASERVLARTLSTIMIPKRFSLPMREIWALQPRLEQTRGGRAKRLLTHPRFRAAYDFLLLRAACGEVPQALADGWTQAQTGELAAPEPDDAADGDEGVAPPARRKRRRRGGRRRRPGAPAPTPAQ
ncbi:polynucleotide adenylyltransferase PcnB [Sinimarinibacterium flocculans]|uniref:Poly(A) polymerase I n=1 Tax=Sinimarinibacterium flocculans TaxID=985250 RepID=A0A318EGM0_9GAMM|nr:polynucleotide adenylyltransferase PcnB [Sinimarinibacterium flocculans]PXV71090.1 poly(A) polymerase [Sinimarinibacterium flocculans]